MGIIWLMVTSLAVVIMIIYIRKYSNDERMAMIDKGMQPSESQSNTSTPLRFALLFIGAGIGLFIAYFLDEYFHMDEVAYFSMIFLFGGLGLGGAYLVEEKKAKERGE